MLHDYSEKAKISNNNVIYLIKINKMEKERIIEIGEKLCHFAYGKPASEIDPNTINPMELLLEASAKMLDKIEYLQIQLYQKQDMPLNQTKSGIITS